MDKIKSILIDTFNLNTDCATPDEIRERITSGGQLRGTNMCMPAWEYVSEKTLRKQKFYEYIREHSCL